MWQLAAMQWKCLVNVGTMFARNQTSPDIDQTQKLRSRHCRMAMSNKCRVQMGEM